MKRGEGVRRRQQEGVSGQGRCVDAGWDTMSNGGLPRGHYT